MLYLGGSSGSDISMGTVMMVECALDTTILARVWCYEATDTTDEATIGKMYL